MADLDDIDPIYDPERLATIREWNEAISQAQAALAVLKRGHRQLLEAWLDQNARTAREAAALTGVPKSTLQRWFPRHWG